MSTTSKAVNSFFRDAIRKDVENLACELLLSDRQLHIYELFYLKKQDINYIADTVGCSASVVQRELRRIRKKLVSALGL